MIDDMDMGGEEPDEIEAEEQNCTGSLTLSVLESGQRVDVYITSQCKELTRSFVQNLIKQELVFVNGAIAKANHRLKTGDIVSFCVPQPRITELLAEDIPIHIVYQDADIAVIDKPQGMVVHPAAGNPTGTLVNALLYAIGDLAGIGGELRPGIVHRIDKDTSGLLVIAKNDAAHRHLSAQIKAKTAGRIYLAIVEGCPKQDTGTIDAPIGRHKTNRKKMAITADGRAAITHYRVLEKYSGYSLLECRLETGRTHQIRVHCASIGHSVVGDTVYGAAKPKLGMEKGQALHAFMLHLVHPKTGQEMTFCAPPPKAFLLCLRKLRHAEGYPQNCNGIDTQRID